MTEVTFSHDAANLTFVEFHSVTGAQKTSLLVPGAPTTVDLSAEVWTIRVILPTGHTAIDQFRVGDHPQTQHLHLAPGRSERLDAGEQPFGGASIRWWRRDNRGNWQHDTPLKGTDHRGRSQLGFLTESIGAIGPADIAITLDSRQHSRAVQLFGGSIGSRFIPVPPQCRVTIRLTAARNHATMPQTQVTTNDFAGDSLLAYLRLGATREARAVAMPLMSLGWFDLPHPSRIGLAHLLIREPNAGQWPTGFLLGDAHTADEAIARGWFALSRCEHGRGELEVEQALAKQNFLAALDLGLPSYHESLLLLARGLRTLRFAGDVSTELDAAYDRVGAYLSAACPAGTTMTFTGSRPDRPSEDETDAALVQTDRRNSRLLDPVAEKSRLVWSPGAQSGPDLSEEIEELLSNASSLSRMRMAIPSDEEALASLLSARPVPLRTLIYLLRSMMDPEDLETAMSILDLTSFDRHRLSGVDSQTIDEFVTLVTELSSRKPMGDRIKVLALRNIAVAMALRFEATSDETDLIDSIHHFRLALELVPPGHADRPALLASLAESLMQQAGVFGDDEAADAAARAAAAESASSPALRSHLRNLAQALALKHSLNGDTSSLDEAIDVVRSLVTTNHMPDSAAADDLALLANLLLYASEAGYAEPAMLDEALDVAARTVELTRPNDSTLISRLAVLRDLSLARWQQTQHPGDLDHAVACALRAARHVPARDDIHFQSAIYAANTLALRFDANGTIDDRDLAIELTREVATSVEASTAHRIQAAALAGHLCAHAQRWLAAADYLAVAVDLMSLLTTADGQGHENRDQLQNFADIPADAAACALNAGEVRRALALLESGTNTLRSPSLEVRPGVQALISSRPALAAMLSEATTNMLRRDSDGTARHRARLDLNNVLSRIRSEAGFERFFAPMTDDEMTELATSGPIVTINISRYRCDSFIITRRGIELMPLPHIDHESAMAAAEQVTQEALDRDTRGTNDRFNAILKWLSTNVTQPVLRKLLKDEDVTRGEHQLLRVWWMPIGAMRLLPLHAAGEPGSYTDDYIVSSYTPSLEALRWSRIRNQNPIERVPLVVSVPNGEAADPLPGAAEQANIIGHALNGDVDLLERELANVPAVREALRDHTWVHFACHAYSDPTQPTRGYLHLNDGALSIGDIAGNDLNGRVAILSACSTDRSDSQLADESVHVASAFHLAGFTQVVGSMWPVDDSVAITFARELYEAIAPDGHLHPAELASAVRHAARAMRSASPHPTAWASYCHTGT